MPLNFQEIEKPKEPVEFFVKNTKARPLELEGEVLPELIRKCGDVKSGRIEVAGVERYLDANVLIFDRELLKNLFTEADYKKEGSLDAKALKAALSARYPKRQLHREWRQLASLLLNTPDLVLAEDIVVPKTFEGSFNKDNVWDSPPKELPPIKRRTKRTKPKSAPAAGEWKATSDKLAATTTLPPAAGATTTTSTTTLPPATMRTSGGIKSTQPIAAEQEINNQGLAPVGPAADSSSVPRATFEGAAAFGKFSQGLELVSGLGASVRSGQTVWSPGQTQDVPSALEAMYGSGKGSVRAWGAALPPSSITLSASALHSLRNTVRSTMTHKPAFETMHAPLTAAETDLKRTLGLPMDVSTSLARVEPVRPTKVLYNADYLSWGDYSRTCPTAPTKWYNEHPSAPVAPGEHKYPWC